MLTWHALEDAEPPELLAAARALPAWTREHVENISAALVVWVERALSSPLTRPNRDDTVAALHDLIGRLRASHGDAALEAAAPGTVSAWKMLETVLDERAGKQGARATHLDVAALLKRKNVAAALHVLATANCSQSDLKATLNIKSDAAMSQLVGMLEAAALVTRERDRSDARVKQLSLSADGRRAINVDASASASDAIKKAQAQTITNDAPYPHGGIAMARA